MAAEPNYDYSGIGKAEALLIYSALAASSWAFLTTGFLGTVVFQLLTYICTQLANVEVLILNVAATDIQTLIGQGDFDATFDQAFKQIQANKDKLTTAQKAKIDAPVIAAFTKFAIFGQLSNNSNP